MTEDQAKQTTCCDRDTSDKPCIASQCMAWRWKLSDDAGSPYTLAMAIVKGHGGCGKCGEVQ